MRLMKKNHEFKVRRLYRSGLYNFFEKILRFKLKMKRREKLNHYMNNQNICGKSTDDSDLSFIET